MKTILKKYSKSEISENNKDLHKLKREELLELMVALSEENDALREKNNSLERELSELRDRYKQEDTFTKTAHQVNQFMNSVKAAVDCYMESMSQDDRKKESEDNAEIPSEEETGDTETSE